MVVGVSVLFKCKQAVVGVRVLCNCKQVLCVCACCVCRRCADHVTRSCVNRYRRVCDDV